MKASKLTDGLLKDGLMTVREVVKFTSLSRSKIYELTDSGVLPYRKIQKLRRIPRAAVVKYLEEQFADG